MSAISVLKTAYGQIATKEHSQAPDGTVNTTSYPQVAYFSLSTEEVDSFDGLAALLQRLENDDQKDKFVIRGTPVHGVYANQRVRRRTHVPTNDDRPNEHPFTDTPHNWLMIDLDHIALPQGMSIVDAPEDIICMWG